MKERIVCVEWNDASSNSGYYDDDHPEKFRLVRTRTVGHLVRKDRNVVVVSQDRFYDVEGKPDDDRHISTIPRGMIKKITELQG